MFHKQKVYSYVSGNLVYDDESRDEKEQSARAIILRTSVCISMGAAYFDRESNVTANLLSWFTRMG